MSYSTSGYPVVFSIQPNLFPAHNISNLLKDINLPVVIIMMYV